MGYSIVATQTSADLTSAAVINQLQENITTGLPPGTIIEMALADTMAAPWMLCDGSALNRTTYAVLYAAVTKTLGAVTISNGTPGVITLGAGDWTEGQCIELTTTDTLPTGLSVNTNYYIHRTGAGTANVSTSRVNLAAGTYVATSSAGAGVHTARLCPWGISGADDFLLPDLEGIDTVMPGDATVNGRTKTGPACVGDVQEDQFQKWQLGATADVTGARNYWGSSGARDFRTSFGAQAGDTYPVLTTTNQGVRPLQAMDDGTNGTPRTGTTTRTNRIGMNRYIKYE